MKFSLHLLLLASTALAAPAWAEGQSSSADGSTRQEIEAIRAQIQALQARLDRLEATTNAGAAPAPAATGATAAAPPSATASASAAPAAQPATPARGGSLPAWAADTTIGGRMFLNISNIDHKSDGADTSQSGLQTDVKRLYLIVDHKFSETLSANITTDFRYNSNGTTRDTLVFIKKAFVQARFGPEFFVRVGAADLPWVPYVEDIYGYRYVENVVVDRARFGTSTDWGVHVGGTIGDGLVSYAASAVNGAGFKTLSRSSDTIDLEGRVSVQPVKGLSFAVGVYSGKLGKSIASQPATPHRATRFNALAAYVGGPIRIGGEYFWARNWNQVVSDPGDRSSGWSVFGSYAFMPRLAAFGRYDRVKPSRRLNPALEDEYFNLGLSYQLIKNVDLALVYKRDVAENGLIPTSNGTIGGAVQGTYDEFGIWAQLRF